LYRGFLFAPYIDQVKLLCPSCTRGSPWIAWPGSVRPSASQPPQDPQLEAASPGKEQGTTPQGNKNKEIKDDSGSCIYITDPQGLLKSSRPNLLGYCAQEYPRGSPLSSPHKDAHLSPVRISCQRESCTSLPTGTQGEPLSTTWPSEYPLR